MNATLNLTGTGATILVVEDNASARLALEALLGALGYKTLSAADPDTAITLFQTQPDAVDLVISDLLLPQMNGLELFVRLKQVRPALRCIIMSGYPLEEEYERLLRYGVRHWIQKPFNLRDLSALLQTVLNG